MRKYNKFEVLAILDRRIYKWQNSNAVWGIVDDNVAFLQAIKKEVSECDKEFFIDKEISCLEDADARTQNMSDFAFIFRRFVSSDTPSALPAIF